MKFIRCGDDWAVNADKIENIHIKHIVGPNNEIFVVKVITMNGEYIISTFDNRYDALQCLSTCLDFLGDSI
jgi:hypothetical protein